MTQKSTAGELVFHSKHIDILRYRVPGWEALEPQARRYVYHLSEACLYGRDILYLQHHPMALAARTILEAIWEQGTFRNHDLEDYLTQLWMYSGFHHHYKETKTVPAFSQTYFHEAVLQLPYDVEAYLEAQGFTLDALEEMIFDPSKDSLRRADGDRETLVERSAVNFYGPGVTTEEALRFYEERKDKYRIAPGLNSRLIKDEKGELRELTAYTDGLYGDALQAIVRQLTAALSYAPSEEASETLRTLISYYESGDIDAFADYSELWVRLLEPVDLIHGFIETYDDPLGLKGSYEGIVELEDPEGTSRVRQIVGLAGYFEEQSPIDETYKRTEPLGRAARAIDVVMLAGDSYPASPLGINLPNDERMRAEVGSKSVTLSNIALAIDRYRSAASIDLFYHGEEVKERLRRFGAEADMLHTDLHEIIGHGSGKLLPGVSGVDLREYDTCIEEARADINALYFIADPKLVELGILPSSDAYRAEYDRYLTSALITQLSRLGDDTVLREAHMQNRALIARYALQYPEVVTMEKINGEHFVLIHDYDRLREIFGELLRELQRIKSCGDYEAAADLVARYGTEVDPELKEEAIRRDRATGMAPYIGFVNPRLTLRDDSVEIDYTEGFIEQNLRYSEQYRTLALPLESFLRKEHKVYDEGKWHDRLNAIRQRLRKRMNGDVSKSMRDKGLQYGINFGVSLPDLREIADEQPRDRSLADLMWTKEVREMRLLSLMIRPREELTRKDLLTLASQCRTIEESEQLVVLLLIGSGEEERVALEVAKQSPDSVLPWVVLTRLAVAGTASSRFVKHSLDSAEEVLSEERPLQATNILRGLSRLAERQPEMRQRIARFAQARAEETDPFRKGVGEELTDLLDYLRQ